MAHMHSRGRLCHTFTNNRAFAHCASLDVPIMNLKGHSQF